MEEKKVGLEAKFLIPLYLIRICARAGVSVSVHKKQKCKELFHSKFYF